MERVRVRDKDRDRGWYLVDLIEMRKQILGFFPSNNKSSSVNFTDTRRTLRGGKGVCVMKSQGFVLVKVKVTLMV